MTDKNEFQTHLEKLTSQASYTVAFEFNGDVTRAKGAGTAGDPRTSELLGVRVVVTIVVFPEVTVHTEKGREFQKRVEIGAMGQNEEEAQQKALVKAVKLLGL